MFTGLINTFKDKVVSTAIEDTKPEKQTNSASKTPQSFDFMGSIMGTTQNKKSELDQQVMDMIVDENRTLKQALEKVASESEDLRE